MTWFGIVNPAAGRKGSPINEVRSLADDLALECVFMESRSPDHVAELVAGAVARGVTKFLAVGGDGTANLVLDAMLKSAPAQRFTLGIVPTGSGSDFMRTFGHRRDIGESLGRIAAADLDLYSVDVGLAKGTFGERYFLNALNVGVAAASVARADSLPRWIGSPRYTAAFWIALWSFRNADVDVDVDRHSFTGNAINVVVANGQFFGGGLNIAPRSVLGDGEMDVQVFRGPRRQAFAIMPRVLMGTHLTHRGVQRYSGSHIHVSAHHGWPVEADGEILGTGSVDIEVIHDAIDIVI